ncbi:MAG: caspase family protein, partial [Gemmatimonadaceae bacterium]
MAGNVHALLVGIDKYPEPRHQLSGCRNDVEELAAVLALRVPTGSLHLKKLLDGEATRDGVISTFRAHLGQAKAGDTALFFYAGHGSRERAPEVFWPTEPDRLDE